MGLKYCMCFQLLVVAGCADAWRTADQEARALYEDGEFVAAAERFRDPMWRAVSLYAAKDFEAAAEAFTAVPTADGFYDLGVCRALLGQYEEALQAFDDSLAIDPDHADARFNRDLVARILAARNRDLERPDTDEVSFAPDEIQFDEKGEQGKAGRVDETTLTPAQTGELWLRQIQTTPADFLRRKFALQAGRGR